MTPCPLNQGRVAAVRSRSLASACLFAALAASIPAPVLAQSPSATPARPNPDEAVVLEEFEVKGIRASLSGAQEIKQQAPVFVDSIVAQDIGKLPDNSVADALQRISGIQVARSNGEVNNVLIRGLPDLATTLNGHEIFTGTGRGVALQDIGAELVAGVDVFKSSSPDQIEGGIAGLIDIRLRRPFDFEGMKLAAGGRAVYGENAEKMSYVGNVLASNRWKLSDGGDFGLLYAASYDRRRFVDQISFNFLFEPVPIGLPGQTVNPTFQLPLTQGSQIVPGDRRRTSHNLSLQWRPSSSLELYSDLLYTGYKNKHQVHFLIGFPRFGAFPYQSVTTYPGTNIGVETVSTNNFHLTSTQSFRDRTDGYQGVLGAKWKKDNLTAGTELVYNWSKVKHRAVILDTQFRPASPATFHFYMNKDGMADLSITGADVNDANNYYLWGLFDNHDYQRSKQLAWKADAEFSLGSELIRSIKGGVRVTDRDATSRATAVNDIAPADGRGTRSTASIPGFGSVSPSGVFDDYSTPSWYGADPDYLLKKTAEVRALFGRAAQDPAYNPASAFDNKEQSYAAYGQANYRLRLGELPLDGLFGARVVRTEFKMTGYRPDGTPLKSNESQIDILPVVNGRLKLQENLLLRLSAGRTVRRPNFVDLNPAASLTPPTTTGGEAGTGSGGNPDLKTVRSDNYDVSLEYYFAPASYVSVAGFYRSIDGYVQTFATMETLGGINYIVTRPRNSGKGHLQGIEAGYQHFPEFLPPVLKGLGWQANFTYTTGKTDTADTSPGAALDARITQAYSQVAKYAYNLIGIYERGPFSARVAYNWRGEYPESFGGPNAPGSPLRRIFVKPTKTLDVSASYAIGEHFTVTLDITNLLESRYQDYFYKKDLYPRDTRAYDRTFALGVRYSY